jgi:hypothetical protein
MRVTLHIAAALMILCSFSADVSTDHYRGVAFAEGDANPIYSEVFDDKFVNGRHIETATKYYNTENKLIATRSLNFSKSRFAPDFTTEDLRTGYLEGAVVTGSHIKLFFRRDKISPTKEKTIDVPHPAVVDGGFNQFIKSNWTLLEKGESVVFYFTVSSKLDYYKLRAIKVNESNHAMKVKIEPDQPVLRWLASPIIVTYDISTKRIMSYEGKSNITDDNGANIIVKLIYPEKGP